MATVTRTEITFAADFGRRTMDDPIDTSIRLYGSVDDWPSKDRMAAILQAAGLAITVGPYSIRVDDCDHFKFQTYGGDICDPSLDADADDLDTMLHDAGRVSSALATAGIRHRFELYDDADTMMAYLHHDWPQDAD